MYGFREDRAYKVSGYDRNSSGGPKDELSKCFGAEEYVLAIFCGIILNLNFQILIFRKIYLPIKKARW
jgi:hypothetical protein